LLTDLPEIAVVVCQKRRDH